jgi:hypothetical protein
VRLHGPDDCRIEHIGALNHRHFSLTAQSAHPPVRESHATIFSLTSVSCDRAVISDLHMYAFRCSRPTN